MGQRLAALARSIRCNGPTLLIAGGETVVTVTGSGRGGRSQELALAAALEWERAGSGFSTAVWATGTDGADGPTDAAGACIEAGFLQGREALREEAKACLADNDSHAFLDRQGALIRTGPTETNVMDMVLIWIDAEKGS